MHAPAGSDLQLSEGFTSVLGDGLRSRQGERPEEHERVKQHLFGDCDEQTVCQKALREFHESANDFHKDLNNWVTEVSEVFHYKVFFIELFGQLLYSVLGPLSYPVLLPLYGGIVGLKNRGFWIFAKPDRATIMQFLTWACLFSAIIAMCFFDDKNEVTRIERRLTFLGLLMRNAPVATKYAYTSTPTWKEMNTKFIDGKYRSYMNLLTGWLHIPAENFELQAEVAFVTILGSRNQRCQTLLKFLPWPRSEQELLIMRERVDITSKTMFSAPTGRMLQESSRGRRRAERRPILQYDEEAEGSPNNAVSWKQRSLTDLGQIRAGLVTASLSTLPRDGSISKPGLIDEHKDWDADIFRAAANGKPVPIEDLFLYILRSVLRDERAVKPPVFLPLLMFTITLVLLPSILRGAKSDGYGWPGMFGTGVGARIAIIGMFPSAIACFLSSSIFMVTGALDVWRRRALMRSCAAMLSVQREFRRHCPPEVDMLPILDLSDITTIGGWRKLRQLCHEWGKFYHVRIRAFTAQFLFLLLIIVGELVAGMLIYPAYSSDITKVTLTSMVVSAGISALLISGIVLMVYLGNEVNASVERHIYLLFRQRSLMLALRFNKAERCEKLRAVQSTEMPLDECTEMLGALGEELDFEGKVRPLTLFGLRLGWSLLSALNFIPLGVATTVWHFCTDDDKGARCQL